MTAETLPTILQHLIGVSHDAKATNAFFKKYAEALSENLPEIFVLAVGKQAHIELAQRENIFNAAMTDWMTFDMAQKADQRAKESAGVANQIIQKIKQKKPDRIQLSRLLLQLPISMQQNVFHEKHSQELVLSVLTTGLWSSIQSKPEQFDAYFEQNHANYKKYLKEQIESPRIFWGSSTSLRDTNKWLLEEFFQHIAHMSARYSEHRKDFLDVWTQLWEKQSVRQQKNFVFQNEPNFIKDAFRLARKQTLLDPSQENIVYDMLIPVLSSVKKHEYEADFASWRPKPKSATQKAEAKKAKTGEDEIQLISNLGFFHAAIYFNDAKALQFFDSFAPCPMSVRNIEGLNLIEYALNINPTEEPSAALAYLLESRKKTFIPEDISPHIIKASEKKNPQLTLLISKQVLHDGLRNQQALARANRKNETINQEPSLEALLGEPEREVEPVKKSKKNTRL